MFVLFGTLVADSDFLAKVIHYVFLRFLNSDIHPSSDLLFRRIIEPSPRLGARLWLRKSLFNSFSDSR